MTRLFAGVRRIVVKLGSASVSTEDGAPNAALLASLAADITLLSERGVETLIVSSGAVALGRRAIGVERTASLEEKQAAAAVGQARLMAAWGAAFEPHGKAVGQMLLTLSDTEDRRRYLNARGALEALLKAGAVPIINENDSVATAEIRYGDNDRLGAHAAQMAGADLLILLTDVDGLYTADPARGDGELIPRVERVTDEIYALAGAANAARGVGSGGMRSKLDAARIAARAGVATVIARGVNEQPLLRLETGAPHTRVEAETAPGAARARWIAGRQKSSGVLTLDMGAAAAVAGGASVLAAGVVSVDGAFTRGDAVRLIGPNGVYLGVGLVAYEADEVRAIAGLRSEAIEGVLGYRRRPAVVHRDDLALADPLQLSEGGNA